MNWGLQQPVRDQDRQEVTWNLVYYTSCCMWMPSVYTLGAGPAVTHPRVLVGVA